jgi:hypothetical protein
MEGDTYSNESLKSEFPAIAQIYPIAIDSYDVMAKRVEAVDNKLQAQLTVMLSVFVVIPTLLKDRGYAFSSPWFVSSMIVLTGAIAIALYARLAGNLKVLKPREMYKKFSHLKDYEFMTDMIIHANNAFDANHQLVTRKWSSLKYSLFIFSLSMGLLVAWAILSGRS